MKNLIAICGLDCETCDARIATLTDDDALREKTAKAWSEMNHALITPGNDQLRGLPGGRDQNALL